MTKSAGGRRCVAKLRKNVPTAAVLGGMMMLRYLIKEDAANRLERAVAAVIQEGV